jgi:hypothetical protein
MGNYCFVCQKNFRVHPDDNDSEQNIVTGENDVVNDVVNNDGNDRSDGNSIELEIIKIFYENNKLRIVYGEHS